MVNIALPDALERAKRKFHEDHHTPGFRSSLRFLASTNVSTPFSIPPTVSVHVTLTPLSVAQCFTASSGVSTAQGNFS